MTRTATDARTAVSSARSSLTGTAGGAGEILYEDFDDLTDGNINGQSGWVASTANWLVGAAYAHNGGKGVAATGTANENCYKVGDTKLADGSQRVWVRMTLNNASDHWVGLREGAGGNIGAYISIRSDGTVKIFNGILIAVGTYSSATWFSLDIEWRDSDKKIRLSVDEGAFSAWVAAYQNWTTGMDTVYFNCDSSVNAMWVDDVGFPGTSDKTRSAASRTLIY